jgi:hypothetical protein
MMSTHEKDEFDVILDWVWGEPMPSNTDPQTEENAKVFRSDLLTALKREHSSVFKNPKTEAKIQQVRSTCLAKLKQQKKRQPPSVEQFANKVAVMVANLIPKTEYAYAYAYANGMFYAMGSCDGMKPQPKGQQVQTNDAILRFHKKSDQHWVVSFSTKAAELKNKQLRLIICDQSGKELVNAPQQLKYDNERWRFRYDVYLNDQQVQQVKTTVTVE